MNLKNIFFAATGLFFLVSSGAALSASNASVEIEWSGFNITPLSLLPGAAIPGTTLSNEVTDLFAEVGTVFEQNDVSDWFTAFSVSEGSGAPGQANSEVTSNNLVAGSQAWDSAAYADFSRSGTYTVSGDGLLLFEIPYMLEVGTSGESTDFADAIVELLIEREDQNGNGSDQFMANSELILSGDVNGSTRDSKSRNLTLALLVEDGDELYFEAYGSAATSASVVPVPAAFWLLSTAMIGMAGLSRRK